MAELDDFRQQKDEYFTHGENSPLELSQREVFDGLAYYPENPDLRLEGPAQEFPDKETIQMQTSTGDIATFRKWGRFSFDVEGQPAEVTLFEAADGGYLFLPFMDATGGDETYGAGRYLEPHLLDDGSVVVDFNYAYSPYCAYNAHWSCPIPPAENRLKVPIRAGEKDFPGETHTHEQEHEEEEHHHH